jgi:hypothetical protein
MVWRGLSDYVISSGRGDGDKNGGCPIPTPRSKATSVSLRSLWLRQEAQAVLRRGNGGLSSRLISLIRNLPPPKCNN